MGIRKSIKNSYEELRKVTWPSRRDTLRMVFIVIAFSIVVALLLAAADSFFTVLMKKFIFKV